MYNIYGQSITHDYQLSIDSNIEQDFSISSIFPNPFNPEVNISFFNPKNNQVSVKIYDLNGRLVDTLYDNFLNAGLHALTWNAKNNSSGIYIITIESENSYISSKMSLLK